MKKRVRVLVLALVLPLVYCVIYVCVFAQVDNSFASFRVHHGAKRRDVTALADLYGVSPKDFTQFGLGPFPVNYIEHTLGLAEPASRRPTVYRREVESIVRGHVAECETNISTMYLFYSDWLSPKNVFHGEALVMEARYKWDDEQGKHDGQILDGINVYSISDSGPWHWEGVVSTCIPPARYVECRYRLPVVGCFDR